MKVSIPFTINNCEGDCPFWEFTEDNMPICNFKWNILDVIPNQGIPDWCPLKKFEIK